MIKHIVRIAPSPTGLFHIGTARTALFNWLIARASGGKFILRIDDTDFARNTFEALQVIEEAMLWLGLDADVCVRQSDRLDLYTTIIQKLLQTGLARHDGDAVRLYAPIPDSWQDTLAGHLEITGHDQLMIDGLVLMRSNGMPTYHFASVVDDMDFGVTWVVRGVDHLSNTSKHVTLWNALATLDWSGNGRTLPLFTHLGLITQHGKKVSKRDRAASLLDYRDQGIDPDAMINWLLRLGWGPTIDDKTTKMITRDKAISLFLNGGRMRSSSANMDSALLTAFDRKYKGAKFRKI